MPIVRHLIPDAATLKDLSVPELAGYALDALTSSAAKESGLMNRRNFCITVAQEYGSREVGMDHGVGEACSAAWSWLETSGLICKHPEQDNEWYIVTQRGRSVRDRIGVQALVRSQQLPESYLHPELLLHARPLYFQGRFDTAVFEAFKALEVSIRDAAKLDAGLVGTKLAARAFNPEGGPLSDLTLDSGERVALMNLMSGALGSAKNPSSHRRVALGPDEARDLIILASYLLNIVDTRRNA